MSPVTSPPLLTGIPPTFQWPVKYCFYTTLTTYVLSLITGNVSQVDRVWTFLPVIYTAYYALLPFWPYKSTLPLFPTVPDDLDRALLNEPNPRTILMLALQLLWCLRLSYNTWRRGLFNFKDEDYRWEILRQKIPPWLFQVFNLTFIAITQNILLFLLALPTHNAAILPPTSRSLQTSDYILTGLCLMTLAIEFTADNQQYVFQKHKRTGTFGGEWPGARIAWTQADVQRGFITRGLWAWSRHPNFAAEQTFWILQSFFPLLATPRYEKVLEGQMTPLWGLLPALALCALFFSSTLFTEAISESKYPTAFRAYRSRVAMFNPLLTPVWGLILKLRGKQEYVDRMVWGDASLKKAQ